MKMIKGYNIPAPGAADGDYGDLYDDLFAGGGSATEAIGFHGVGPYWENNIASPIPALDGYSESAPESQPLPGTINPLLLALVGAFVGWKARGSIAGAAAGGAAGFFGGKLLRGATIAPPPPEAGVETMSDFAGNIVYLSRRRQRRQDAVEPALRHSGASSMHGFGFFGAEPSDAVLKAAEAAGYVAYSDAIAAGKGHAAATDASNAAIAAYIAKAQAAAEIAAANTIAVDTAAKTIEITQRKIAMVESTYPRTGGIAPTVTVKVSADEAELLTKIATTEAALAIKLAEAARWGIDGADSLARTLIGAEIIALRAQHAALMARLRQLRMTTSSPAATSTSPVAVEEAILARRGGPEVRNTQAEANRAAEELKTKQAEAEAEAQAEINRAKAAADEKRAALAQAELDRLRDRSLVKPASPLPLIGTGLLLAWKFLL